MIYINKLVNLKYTNKYYWKKKYYKFFIFNN